MSFWNDPTTLTPKQSHRWVISYFDTEVSDLTISPYFIKSIDRPTYKIDVQPAKYLYAHTFNFPKRLVWNPIKIELYDLIDEDIKKGYQLFLRDPTLGKNNKTIVEGDGDGNLKAHKRTSQLALYYFLQRSGYFDPFEQNPQLLRFRSYHFKKNMIEALTAQKTYAEDRNGAIKYVTRESESEQTTSRLLTQNSEFYKNDYFKIIELAPSGDKIEEWLIYNPLVTDVTSDRLDYEADGVLKITVGITYDWARLVPKDQGASTEKITVSSLPPKPPKKVTRTIDVSSIFPSGQSLPANPEEARRLIAAAAAEAGITPGQLAEAEGAAQRGEARFAVRAYASTEDSAARNLLLSEQRANFVSETLQQAGVQPEAIDARGLGETEQFGRGESENARAQNRRVTVSVTYTETEKP